MLKLVIHKVSLRLYEVKDAIISAIDSLESNNLLNLKGCVKKMPYLKFRYCPRTTRVRLNE
jgi:hypothetical protein